MAAGHDTGEQRGRRAVPIHRHHRIRAYVQLARAHVSLEDDYFFPLAAQILSASEDGTLADRLAEIDAHISTRSADEQRYERLVSDYLSLVDR